MQFPRIPPEERLRRDQELQVVDCVIALLIEHGLCMRHEGLLIFPSLFRPTQAEAVGEAFSHDVSLHYDFSGPIDNIYASLITSLAISRRFGPMRLWQDRAEFGRAGAESSGLRRVRQGNQAARGHARLEVYFDSGTPEATRELFVNFIEEHLAERGVELLERLAVTCVCGRIFAEDDVQARLQRGSTFIQCQVCDHQTPLTLGAAQARERNPTLVEQLHALNTDIRERLSGEIIGVKIEAEMTKREEPRATSPLRILHLSDLHVGAEDDPDSLFQPLEADLADHNEGLGLERLDYLVISGDITHRASPQEFEKAHAFVSKLIKRFELNVERCIIVPGNHDLDWETEVYTWRRKRHVRQEQLTPGAFIEAGDGYNLRDDATYPERFKNFSQHFYHPLTQKRYPLAPEEQCLPVLFSEDRLQFLAMNSAWEIDEYFQDRASISAQALARGLPAAEQQRRDALTPETRVLRLGVWHHPITGNGKIHDTAFVERLLQADVHLCLHGHVHEERADLVNYLHSGRRMHVVGAGSFGAPMHHRPESVPRLFNLLEVQRDLRRLKVHTRGLRRQGGAWEGWAVWPWPGGERGAKRSFYELDLP
jgi:predicted phosphodiesterase